MVEEHTPNTETPGDGLCEYISPQTGKKCRGRAWRGNRCPFHHPENKEKILNGRKRGGLRTQEKIRMLDLTDLPLDSPAECEASLKKIILAVASGRMTDSTARTLTQLIKLKLETVDLKRIQETLDEQEG